MTSKEFLHDSSPPPAPSPQMSAGLASVDFAET